jgi:hypothetical protein
VPNLAPASTQYHHHLPSRITRSGAELNDWSTRTVPPLQFDLLNQVTGGNIVNAINAPGPV